jgi:hypothetical protein
MLPILSPIFTENSTALSLIVLTNDRFRFEDLRYEGRVVLRETGLGTAG